MFRRITTRDRPERLAQQAALCQERLILAVQLAAKRAVRSKATIRAVLKSAMVEGLPDGQRVKAGVISFKARPLRGLHVFYPWQLVERSSKSELAGMIAEVVRRRVAEKERCADVPSRTSE